MKEDLFGYIMTFLFVIVAFGGMSYMIYSESYGYYEMQSGGIYKQTYGYFMEKNNCSAEEVMMEMIYGRVNGNVCQSTARVIELKKGIPVYNTYAMTFLKENGVWKLSKVILTQSELSTDDDKSL